ncbi:MAG: DUF1150 family protein [Alphaproteobacteria bacterium]|nr:DUF1150 family protein [Alphaproteobacteria bacterium]
MKAASETMNRGGQLEPGEFLALGLDKIAYVKPKQVGERMLYAIHSADGNEVGLAEERAQAFAAIIQHDLAPLSVH